MWPLCVPGVQTPGSNCELRWFIPQSIWLWGYAAEVEVGDIILEAGLWMPSVSSHLIPSESGAQEPLPCLASTRPEISIWPVLLLLPKWGQSDHKPWNGIPEVWVSPPITPPIPPSYWLCSPIPSMGSLFYLWKIKSVSAYIIVILLSNILSHLLATNAASYPSVR